MVSSLTIDAPQKLGIGGYPTHGTSRLLADVAAIDAGWFYTWSAALPDLEIQDWLLGDDVALTGSVADRSLTLGGTGNAWTQQSAAITGGLIYEFSVDVSGLQNARGGIAIDFLDGAGARLGGGWMPIDAMASTALLTGLRAPDAATTAKIVTWGEVAGLTLDNVALTAGKIDAVVNGGFERSFLLGAGNLPMDHVPMVWGRGNADAGTLGRLAGEDVILAFNEPDNRLQAGMSVAEAIRLWPDLMATGARLGSPATTTPQTLGNASWLGRFMAEADNRDLRVDFVAVHYYSANKSVDAFKTFLEKTHAAYDRPIWVTEWALVDWRDTDRFSFAETSKFLREATLMMDDLDFVERQAWFGTYDGLDGLNLNTHLFDAAGDLTPVGRTFADFAPDRILLAGPDGDTLVGGAGDDTLKGSAGADTLIAGLGADSMIGGLGADSFVLGEADRINFGDDRIRDFKFSGAGADTLIFDYAGKGHALTNPADFAAFATQLAEDGSDSTAASLIGNDLVIAFGEGRGSVTLEQAGFDSELRAAFETAPAPAAQTIAQYGSVTATHMPTSVRLSHAFDDPIVFATATTMNGLQPFSIRVSSTSADGFTLYLDEPGNLDGRHAPEKISWMVVERGRWQSDQGIIFEAGIATTDILSSRGTTLVAFGVHFDSAPIVLTTGQTDHGSDMLWTRAKGVTPDGFDLILQKEEALNNGRHPGEDIGWLAMMRGGGAFDGGYGNTMFETSKAGATVKDRLQKIDFDIESQDSSVFLAGISSMRGPDPVGLRFSDLQASGVRGTLQEDTSRDIETTHTVEALDWLSLSGGGSIFGTGFDLIG